MHAPSERWTRGDAYESYIGRWSRLVARELVDWLRVAPGAEWLDVGCGTGALAATILDRAAAARVRAVDASPAYVAHARGRLADRRALVAAADARALPFAAASADAVVSGLVLNFVPQPARMVAELRRVARDGATVSAYVWDYADGMQLLRHFWDAAVALDPAAAALDEGARFPLCRPDALAAAWRDAELADVATRALEVPTRFRDHDDLWAPFLAGEGPAPGYVASLAPAARERLRERLLATLPVGPDGAIALVARAWAVRGVRR